MAKDTNFVSPRGTAKYPKLDQPYSYNTKAGRSMPDPDGQYEVVVTMPNAEAAPFVKKIQAVIEDSGIDPTNLPYKQVKDKDTKKPTGETEFKFKDYGKAKDGSPKKIKFFDRKGKLIPKGVSLTGGSVIKIDGYITVAKLGARLNIKGVQVISLAEASSGFTEEDGDFEYEDNGIEEDFAGGDSNEATDSEDDFDF